MRTAFRRELKKVQNSKKTGSSGDTYEPTLWYYDLLLFTVKSETGRKGRSTDEVEDNLENDTLDTVESNNGDPNAYEDSPLTPFSSMSDSDLNKPEQNTDTTSLTSGTSASKSCCKKTVRQKSKNINSKKKEELVDLAHMALSSRDNESEDEYQVTGKRLGYQLRNMDQHQRIIAEKLISDVMFYAKIGQLTEDSAIYIPSYSRSYPMNSSSSNCKQAHYVPYPRSQQTTQEQNNTYSIVQLDNQQMQNSESTSSIGEYLQTYQPQEY